MIIKTEIAILQLLETYEKYSFSYYLDGVFYGTCVSFCSDTKESIDFLLGNIEQIISKNVHSSIEYKFMDIEMPVLEFDIYLRYILDNGNCIKRLSTVLGDVCVYYIHEIIVAVFEQLSEDEKRQFICIDDHKFYLFSEPCLLRHRNLNRHFREFLHIDMERKGYSVIHAAALTYQEIGIVILGNSGAGKTTSVLSFATNAQSAFVSNDRLFLSEQENQLVAYSYPLSISIGRKTAEFLSWNNLCDWIFVENAKTIKRQLQLFQAGYKFKLLPADLRENTNIKMVNRTICHCVLLPTINLKSPNSTLFQVNDQYETIRELVYGDTSFNDKYLLYRGDEIVRPSGIDNIINRLNSLPIYQITIGNKFDKRILDMILPKLSDGY